MKPSEYLDQARKELGLPSDYALQKPLQLSKQQLSKYRNDQDAFSDEVAIRIATVLELPVWRVLVDMHTFRAKSPEARAAWVDVMGAMEKISKSFKDLLLGCGPRQHYV